jgi:hypothetical protein
MLICVVFVSPDMILEDKPLISEVVLSQSVFICMILERHTWLPSSTFYAIFVALWILVFISSIIHIQAFGLLWCWLGRMPRYSLVHFWRLVGFANYSWSWTPLCLISHLSIAIMSLSSTCRPTLFSINTRSMLRSISTSSVIRLSLGKFAFCMSRWFLSSLTSSPMTYCLHSSLSFAPVLTSVMTRVGTVRVLDLFIYLCCIICIWASRPPTIWGLARTIRNTLRHHLLAVRPIRPSISVRNPSS